MRCFANSERVVEANRTILKRTIKVVTYERILAPGFGGHLSHNLVSAQIKTAKQQPRRTDAAVFRFPWKERRLIFRWA
jgi:hypothetical protein